MAYELDAQMQEDIRKGQRLLNEADELSRRCANCGFDMSAQDALSQALRQRFEAIQKNFGGNKRD